MPNQKIIDYIKSCKKKGYSLNQIRQALFSAGWPSEMITKAIQLLQPRQKIRKPYKKPIIFIITAFIAIGTISAFLLLNGSVKQSDSDQNLVGYSATTNTSTEPLQESEDSTNAETSQTEIEDVFAESDQEITPPLPI